MFKTSSRAAANMAMLEFVARKLSFLTDDVVFVGGCATALLISDHAAPDIRSTLDVDCIIDVVSLVDYYKLEANLQKLGFKKSTHDAVICRWHYDEMMLDVMPANEKILGFGNRWYAMAIKNINVHKISENLVIKSVSAPYFLATKFEAFRSRGNNDFLMSHDLEDIISVIDGREELLEEVINEDPSLIKYLGEELISLVEDEQFISALPGHLNYGSEVEARFKLVLGRIKKMADVLMEKA